MAAQPGRHLVLEHLEKISGRVLKEYSHVVKGMIRQRRGIYALYRKDKLHYVGLATNLMVRLKSHLRDRHRGLWDRFSVYLTGRDEHMKELESLVLRIVDPAGNRVSGRLRKSTNLRSALNKRIKDDDDNRRALLIGGYVARRRVKTKTRRTKGTRVLKGLVSTRMQLRAWYSGRAYTATLRKDGAISYKGRLYESPSGAAQAIARSRRNGWIFWKYRDSKGAWVPLRKLR